MKRFLIFLIALLCLCCKVSTPAPPKDKTEVTVWREADITLHADVAFTEQGQALITAAADRWRAFTHGRVRIVIVFDLDFDSIENLEAHKNAHSSLIIGVLSEFPITEALDLATKATPTKKPMAVTVINPNEQVVFLIMDRIPAIKFFRVVTHELGHVIGLPDLESYNSVMSGTEFTGAAPVNDFTEADRDLCRAYKYCD